MLDYHDNEVETMIEYGTIDFRRFYLGGWIVEAQHSGSPIIRMTYELWKAAYLFGMPMIGSIFEIDRYKLVVIALDHDRNLITCINKDQPYWWFALLLYKISAFFGWDLYA